MSKIRMNTEFRNKILNRYVESAETETTQEQQAYLGAREKVNELYPQAFRLATSVVERSYPSEDVATCRTLKINAFISLMQMKTQVMKMVMINKYLNILILVCMAIQMRVIIVMIVAKSLLMLIIEKN